jgi:hypothetical protein
LNIGVSRNRFCDFLADPDGRNFSRFTLIFTGAATQLGVMVRRMADPYGPTGITPQEIFKYWEANIAGAPVFPGGAKNDIFF